MTAADRANDSLDPCELRRHRRRGSRADCLATAMTTSSRLSSACAKEKEVYQQCFLKWYSEKFLQGDLKEGCKEEFSAFRDCMTDVYEKRGLGKKIQSETDKYDARNSKAAGT